MAKYTATCHGIAAELPGTAEKMVLVGSPNVGKSVIFGHLTGRYVTVSNYPGTTVEISRGKGKIGEKEVQVIDTPGMYSLLPITEEERVTRNLLLKERPKVVVQVMDAKNIQRMLHLTLQLIEADVPVILVLNLMDEAQRSGIYIDLNRLRKELGIPVVATVATENKGLDELQENILNYHEGKGRDISYAERLESSLKKIEQLLTAQYNISKRAIALLLLQEDPDILRMVTLREKDYERIRKITEEVKTQYNTSINYVLGIARQEIINRIVDKAVVQETRPITGFKDFLSRLMMQPVSGLPILLATIYVMYEFVGVFGAQVAVDFLENTVFGNYINPFVTNAVSSIIPWRVGQDLLVHEYGIITLGVRYAIAIILPIVATFFLAFSIIEDTGYLPRLALLIDRVFKKIGLNGRAVIPVVLGFGCDTMATIVTRTLETRRERIIASFLLALAIPCSAQMGVILALLSGNAAALWIFIIVMASIFLLVGFLTAKIMPGDKPLFYMEVPPLRWPKFSNVFTKTYTRVEWYFREVLPLFVFASFLIWVGRLTGLFDLLIDGLSYPTRWIGLPKEAATAFLYGFFRRDFGAAGLYDLKTAGILHGIPLVVAIVTIALFMPCIAQFAVTIKERGWKIALGMAAFIFPFAFIVGGLLNQTLVLIGARL